MSDYLDFYFFDNVAIKILDKYSLKKSYKTYYPTLSPPLFPHPLSHASPACDSSIFLYLPAIFLPLSPIPRDSSTPIPPTSTAPHAPTPFPPLRIRNFPHLSICHFSTLPSHPHRSHYFSSKKIRTS